MTIQGKIIATLCALAGALALLSAVIYYRAEYKALDAQNESLEAQNATLAQTLQTQQALIAERAETQQMILDIRNSFEQVKTDIRLSQSAISKALVQVKANDKAASAYLDAPVPPSVGRLYVRPETTDPRLYRSAINQGGAVQPDAVQTPGSK